MGAPAEMARVALPVALAAEGSPLLRGPPLGRDPVCRTTLGLDPVAKAPGVKAAVHTRTAQHLLVPRRKHLQGL